MRNLGEEDLTAAREDLDARVVKYSDSEIYKDAFPAGWKSSIEEETFRHFETVFQTAKNKEGEKKFSEKRKKAAGELKKAREAFEKSQKAGGEKEG